MSVVRPNADLEAVLAVDLRKVRRQTIAHSCGFCDHSHFVHAFRRELGITPGEYRRRHHEIDDYNVNLTSMAVGDFKTPLNIAMPFSVKA